jgi:DNA-binding SARP family transcriptional activator
MLRVRLFGTGEAYYQDRTLPGFPHNRACLLFSYLLLNRDYPHNRERLAAIFWGDNPTSTARKNLRNSLWRMRQILQSIGIPDEEFLMISDESVAFLNVSPTWIDIEVFEEITTTYQDISGKELDREGAQRLESAAGLYIGDLLESIYEDWCLYDRERLRLINLNTLNKLVVYHGINGSYERGLEYADRILAIDNTRERIHRHKMRLLWLAGDRNGALAQFKLCAQILREELGIKPLGATRSLYKQILQQQERPTTWQGIPDGSQPDLVGSEETIQSLTENALQKLQRLQTMLEETGVELHQIERLISKALLNSKH